MSYEQGEDLSRLGTEASSPRTAHIDEMGTVEALEAIPAIAAVVDAAHERMGRGGRLIYMGAGTSGRLGVLDASECPPTYGVSPDLVVGLIAGGPEALVSAREGAEDDASAGAADLDAIGVNETDVVVGRSPAPRGRSCPPMPTSPSSVPSGPSPSPARPACARARPRSSSAT